MLAILNRTAPIAIASVSMIFCPAFAVQNSPAITFNALQECTGYDEMDPVAIATDPQKQPVLATVISFIENENEFVVLLDPKPSTLFIFYTPFLYGAPNLSNINQLTNVLAISKENLVAGNYINSLKLKFYDQENKLIVNGIVDFTAFYPESSPFTINTNEQGEITIKCINWEDSGVRFTVRDNNRKYLYDGSLLVKTNIIRDTNHAEIDIKPPPQP